MKSPLMTIGVTVHVAPHWVLAVSTEQKDICSEKDLKISMKVIGDKKLASLKVEECAGLCHKQTAKHIQ
jgi:hypothetical protein